MRLEVLPILVLSACAPIAAGVTVGSIPVLGRSPPDVLVSAMVGRDCSIVHVDAGQPYCRPREGRADPAVFCSRSLGVPDCWSDPAALTDHPREISDGPLALTPAQEAARVKRWPGLW
jgi:hypothetical protein